MYYKKTFYCLYINNKNSCFLKISLYFVNFVYTVSNKFVYTFVKNCLYFVNFCLYDYNESF